MHALRGSSVSLPPSRLHVTQTKDAEHKLKTWSRMCLWANFGTSFGRSHLMNVFPPYIYIYIYLDQARAARAHWALVGRALVGSPGPLWAPLGPCGPP